MDLSKILSISGKSGLFKLVATTKTGAIVESMIDKKRFPVFASEKMSTLEEISMFTTGEDIPLKEVFRKIFDKESGKNALDPKADNNQVKEYFALVLPEYDRDRVYVSDIKKAINWYNLLVNNQMMDFSEEEVPTESKPEDQTESSTENA